jgi:hypothetical protein
VHQLKQREQLLVASLRQQEQLAVARTAIGSTWLDRATEARQVSDLSWRSSWFDLPNKGASERARLAQALAQEDDLTVAQLTRVLAQMPPRTVVLAAGAIQAGRWQRSYQRELVRIAAAVGVPLEDGLHVAEALQILEALNLNPERTLSTTRLLVMAAGQSPGEFSRAGRRVRPFGED